MKDFIITLFVNYALIIVFFHVISAVIWVGGMITIRFSIHYSMQNIEDPQIKLARTLENLKRFFNLIIPCIIILLISAAILAIGLGFKGTPLYAIVHVKEAIWTLMSLVFVYIYIKRNKAEKLFLQNDLKAAKIQLEAIAKYFIPLNIILGLSQILLGIVLRGF